MMNQGFFKQELLKHHQEQMAFLPISELLKEIEYEKVGIRPDGLPYSFYEVFYHIFYAQRDILEFILEKPYRERKWPDAYWPKTQGPESAEAWEELKTRYEVDQAKLSAYLERSEADLKHPVQNATSEEQTLLREVLLILRHTAYHTGQLLVILRLLGLHK